MRRGLCVVGTVAGWVARGRGWYEGEETFQRELQCTKAGLKISKAGPK